MELEYEMTLLKNMCLFNKSIETKVNQWFLSLEFSGRSEVWLSVGRRFLLGGTKISAIRLW